MRFRTCNPEMWRRGMENSLSRRNLRSGGCRKDPLTNPVCPDARLPGPGAKAHSEGGARRATGEAPERTGRAAAPPFATLSSSPAVLSRVPVPSRSSSNLV